MDGFTVNVPELKLLRQYQNDAVSWISRFNNAVQNSHQCNDQEDVVNELTCIIKDGALLKIQGLFVMSLLFSFDISKILSNLIKIINGWL